MLKEKNIVLGVTGGIAVYKAADLVSRLVKKGYNVDVIMTEAAEEFLNSLTFQTMSNNPVYRDMFQNVKNYDVEHISLAKKADIILVAPATANTIGKIANGIADNLLTTVIMASSSKVIFAPAMNTEMYNNPIVQENMKKLEELSYEFIDPGVGLLACGDYGAGKMAEPAEIVEYLESSFLEKDLDGLKILITAGPTIEPIDPVRFISNHSSGKMGYSIAKEAVKRGADVVLVSGPTSLEKPKGVDLVSVRTTQEMFDAVGEYFPDCQILIKAAAPSDYRPKDFSNKKIKKRQNESNSLDIQMVKNPDIVKHYGNMKKNQIVIGFAAETDNLEKYAEEKMKEKNLDFIVANDVTVEGAGFKGDTNIVTIIENTGASNSYPLISKDMVASLILDKALGILKNKG